MRNAQMCVGTLAFGLAMLMVVAVGIPSASAAKSQHVVRVMTRNLYLGADLTPGLHAKSLSELNDAAGAIFNQV